MMSDNVLTAVTPYQDAECRANLAGFVRTQDRGHPPIFVGREKIIERIREDVAHCALNSEQSLSFSLVISGAPGVGKSSLRRELEKRFGGGDSDDGPIKVVSVRWEALSSLSTVAKEFIRAYTGRVVEPKGESTTSKKAMAKTPIVGGEYQTTDTQLPLEQQVEIDRSPWYVVRKNTKVDQIEDVFLFLVDEAQNIRGDVDDPHGKNTILTTLHDGFEGTAGIKVVPVFFGLSDTTAVLSKHGVSRLDQSAKIQLGALSDSETHDLVLAWLQHEPFGLGKVFSPVDAAKVAKSILVASEGWPRHVNTYLKELGRSILAQPCDDQMRIDLDEVLDRGHTARFEYYGGRVADARLGDYTQVLRDSVAVMSNNEVTRESLTKIAQEEYAMSADVIANAQEKAIHAGLLESASLHDPNRFKFSIPSLSTYFQARGDVESFRQSARAQLAANEHLWVGDDKPALER